MVAADGGVADAVAGLAGGVPLVFYGLNTLITKTIDKRNILNIDWMHVLDKTGLE